MVGGAITLSIVSFTKMSNTWRSGLRRRPFWQVKSVETAKFDSASKSHFLKNFFTWVAPPPRILTNKNSDFSGKAPLLV